MAKITRSKDLNRRKAMQSLTILNVAVPPSRHAGNKDEKIAKRIERKSAESLAVRGWLVRRLA